MKLYKVNKWDIKIEEIEVSRISGSSLWAIDRNGKERREAMSTNYADHFETWEGAKNHLIAREQRGIDSTKDKLLVYESRLQTAKELTFVKV